jgi:hypothetical protein
MHCSLDLFMVQMHSQQVAEALDSLSTFGERILSIMKGQPDSRRWWLSPDLLIGRRQWLRLSRRVMNLVHLLGIDVDDDAQDRQNRIAAFEITCPLRSWPDFPKLLAAIRRARGVFEDFAESDGDQVSLRELYWP